MSKVRDKSKLDNIYATKQASIGDFVFDNKVASVFDDMISRSVPLYQEVQSATAALAKRFARPNTVIYDLGCSTGTTLLKLCKSIDSEDIKIVGVDNSEAMLNRCNEKLRKCGFDNRVQLITEDVQKIEIERASVVVMNYTLQFLSPEHRISLLQKIFDGLTQPGALLLTEKICHKHPMVQNTLDELHLDFKRRNGYSELEIAQKREAIENVMIPLCTEDNVEMLNTVGFQNVEPFLKWYNFVSFLAVKYQ